MWSKDDYYILLNYVIHLNIFDNIICLALIVLAVSKFWLMARDSENTIPRLVNK